jgi:hypothetical protein
VSDEAPKPDDDGEVAVDEPPTAPSRWRRLAWVGIAAAALAVPLAARVVWEGRAEIERADRAHDEGDADLEVEHLGRAARWRMPLFGYDEAAIERLIDIGTAAEAEGDSGTQRALVAYREARRAILATRTWGVPDEETFERVNERIARLMADQEVRFGTDVGGEGDPYAHHLALLQEVPGPEPWRANLAAVAFLFWLVATGGFVMRSIDSRGRLIPKPAVRWGLGSLVLLLVWVLALRFAS